MKKPFYLLSLMGLLLVMSFSMQAQSLVIDKIIAKVDNHYILKSELEAQYQQYLQSGDCYQINLTFPMQTRLLQGSADTDVPPTVAISLFHQIISPDLRLTLVKGADHRFSTPDCLDLMTATIEEVLRHA